LTSSEIRRLFLDYFREKDHKIIKSSSLVPDDPTLLLTGAGMVQFKPIFMAEKKVDYSRASTVQKCVRTTDIEKVGQTTRHLTFFEMLGNFSFGDYYKKEAISWAWDLVTNVLAVPKEKLSITIFEKDDEAFEIWHKTLGIPSEKIYRLGEEDNFWSAGPTGPCGPCSEIIYDMGAEYSCAKPDCNVGCDCDRYLEIWNLVFMQYDRLESGELKPLPNKNIDTGMGLERIAVVLQDATNVFETDLLIPVVKRISALSKQAYGRNTKTDTSIKVIADHARAIAFLIGDGVLPSNEGRGYILRRLIRRAVRHGRLIGITEPFLTILNQVVAEIMSDAYPELAENIEFINKITAHEEERFLSTLKQGLAILNEMIVDAQKSGVKELSGRDAFRLYDTYGFPLELTEEIAAENGLSVSQKEFQELMEEQRERARAAWAAPRAVFAAEIYSDVYNEYGRSGFIGYEEETCETIIKAIIKGRVVAPEARKGDKVEVVLAETPFYAEKGGQVGDTGKITTETGTIKVVDTQEPVAGLIIHIGEVEKGSIKVEQVAKAAIDKRRRLDIQRNHTATHLLQWALRLVLGEHVKQAGSLVAPDRLRFDFTHFAPMTSEEVRKTEALVNDKIFENHPVKAYVTSFDYAKEVGAIALFDQKYDEFVRLVEIGNFSKELCGGTHTGRTSEISLFKVVSEGSVAANTRRIEAVTARNALHYFYQEEDLIKQLAILTKAEPDQVYSRISALSETVKQQAEQIEKLSMRLAEVTIGELAKEAKQINATKVLISRVEAVDMDRLRLYVDLAKEKLKSGIIMLASVWQGRVMLVAGATADVVNLGFNASELLKKVAPLVSGGGGGRPDLAQAGGKQPENIDLALAAAWKNVEEQLKVRS
jgi:alanyl-tRNA synthetase